MSHLSAPSHPTQRTHSNEPPDYVGDDILDESRDTEDRTPSWPAGRFYVGAVAPTEAPEPTPPAKAPAKPAAKKKAPAKKKTTAKK